MSALLWKDWRINRAVLGLLAMLAIGPHLGAIMWLIYEQRPHWPNAESWTYMLGWSSFTSLLLAQVGLAILGGNTIAAERADRSAEFLAYLPPTRVVKLVSKVIVAIAAGAGLWAFFLLMTEVVVPALGAEPGVGFQDDMPWINMLAGGLLLFCGGWLGSSLLSSPALAVCLGFAVTFGVPMLLGASSALVGWPPRESMESWMVAVMFITAAACFIGGSWYYLLRVEP